MWTLLPVQFVVALAVTAVTPAGAWPWAQLGAAALVAALATMRIRGRRPHEWLSRSLAARRPDADGRGVDVVDLVAADLSTVGCVVGDRILTTALEIRLGHGAATVPGAGTGGSGGDSADPGGPDAPRLPLALLSAQLDQHGTVFEGIDVVVHGTRRARGPAGEAYDRLVGPLPLIAHRTVHVLLRLDPSDERSGSGLRGEAARAVETTVAVATERARRALVHRGLHCRVLDGEEIADLHLRALAEPRARGRVLGDPAEITATVAERRNQPAPDVTEVYRLRPARPGLGAADLAVVVGAEDDDPRAGAGVRLLPAASERTDPVVLDAMRPRSVDELEALSPTAHGAGQILGASPCGLPLAMPVVGPHLRTVLLAADPVVCRQVVFRALGTGARLAVVTDTPSRWEPLAAFAEPGTFAVVAPESPPPDPTVDAVVLDLGWQSPSDDPGAPVTTGIADVAGSGLEGWAPADPALPAPTVVQIVVTGTATANARFDSALRTRPDLVLDGRVDGWLSVEPAVGEARRVTVVMGPGEPTDLGARTPSEPEYPETLRAGSPA